MSSPRQDGNSDILLNSAIKGAESNGAVVEKIIIRDLQIAPCNSCGGCWEKGDCVIDDDMQKIYPKLVDADGIIVASPIYFMGVSAQLKAFIDRCQAFWARKYVLHLPIREGEGLLRDFYCYCSPRYWRRIIYRRDKNNKGFFHVLDTKYMGDILCAGLEEKVLQAKNKNYYNRLLMLAKNCLRSNSYEKRTRNG